MVIRLWAVRCIYANAAAASAGPAQQGHEFRLLDLLTSAPHYVISLLVLLTIVVFIHELGHFWVARRCGVRVEVFSVGFGPELFGWTDRFGTRWKFSAIPLGGYVKMFGQAERVLEVDGRERDMSDAERAVAFHHKPVWQRAAIVFAGPAANYLLTIVAFALLFAVVGQPTVPTVVGEVQKDSAAEVAGIQTGDRILSINGQPTESFDDLVSLVQNSAGQPLSLMIRRGDAELSISAQPRPVNGSGTDASRQTFRLGLAPGGELEYEQKSLLGASVAAVGQTYHFTIQILVNLWQMVTGERSSQELGGVLRIAKIAGDVASNSYVDFLFLIPALSLNLGLLNLFPIPLLDGGHLTFYGIETIRGRPLGERAQEWGLRIGVAFVLGLVVFATWNDLVVLKVIDYLKNLVT
jgi:regulator of sigma E protease